MIQDPEKHLRRSIRLKRYDYTQPGAYFVTICTHDRVCLFGEVVDGEMRFNELGRVVREEWLKTAQLRPRVVLDAFVVMPNHLHGIIVFVDGRGTLQRAPTARHASTLERFGKPTSDSIPTIVRLFKSAAIRRIHTPRGTPGLPVRQRSDYEHIVQKRVGGTLQRAPTAR
jgi:REP element-mobilizing transposase RayT